MAVPPTLMKALAAALQNHAPPGSAAEGGRDEEEYVRRVIPAINNGELRQGS